MIKKYYWAIAVAAAFVAGTLTTGGAVYASFDQCSNDPPQGISDGKPFLEIWAAICDLETLVGDINVEDNDSDPTNELQTLTGNGDVTLSDGGGTISCEDITGSKDLCDGVDDVGDGGISLPHTYRIFKSVTGTANISCNPGDTILGGGFVGVSSGVNEARLTGNDPEHPTLWRVSPNDASEVYTISVFCADTADPSHDT